MGDRSERETLFRQYAEGVAVLKAAIAAVPAAALTWRPSRGEWSVHEIIMHCADFEINATARLGHLVAEDGVTLQGNNPDLWATALDYHSRPLDLAVATVEAVRMNTEALIRLLPDSAWKREAPHATQGRYSTRDWLRIYSTHLHEHAVQIDNAVSALRQSHHDVPSRARPGGAGPSPQAAS